MVHFTGNAGLATNRARRARAKLRLPGGDWRSFGSIRTAAGGSTDRTFVDVDKNPQQLKRERDSKKLKAALDHLYPSKAFRFNRADGLVALDGVPLALVDPQTDDLPSKLKWHLTAVDSAHIVRDDVLREYKARAQRGPSAADAPGSG